MKYETGKKLISGVGLAALLFGAAAAGLIYRSCFHPRTIENATITEKGIYALTMTDLGYSEVQNTITIDKHKKCLRTNPPFGDNLKVGDRLEYIKWRPGWAGPCDYVVDHQKE